MSNFTKLHLTLEIFRILPVFSQFLWILSSNFLFQGDLTIIPFYPWPGLGLEYKDRYPVEWTGLEGQQHPSHSTLLNAFYLKKLIRQQRCYVLLNERGPLGHTHTIETFSITFFMGNCKTQTANRKMSRDHGLAVTFAVCSSRLNSDSRLKVWTSFLYPFAICLLDFRSRINELLLIFGRLKCCTSTWWKQHGNPKQWTRSSNQ